MRMQSITEGIAHKVGLKRILAVGIGMSDQRVSDPCSLAVKIAIRSKKTLMDHAIQVLALISSVVVPKGTVYFTAE